MHTSLELSTCVSGGRRILTVKGELDMAVSELFERGLLAAVAQTPPGGELVADLSEVRFFAVAALRALLRAAGAAQDARVVLRLTASPVVDRVFELLGIATASLPDGSTGTLAGAWMSVRQPRSPAL